MKLFVTGATGFIGSHFVRQALAAGHDVRALRRTGSQTRIKLDRDPEWLQVPFEQLEPKHFNGIEVLVHLAAHSANVPYDTLENCLHWNVTVPIRMAQRAFVAGVRHFVVAGTCFEYGGGGERYEFIPTNAPLEPALSYPISKAAASIAWGGFCREMQISLSIHRIFQVYGEGEAETRMWPALRASAVAGNDFNMTKGEQIRDFIEVTKVAEQLLGALSTTPNPGHVGIHHIGSGRPQTVRAFAEYWWKRWGATGSLKFGMVPYRTSEVMRYVPQTDMNPTPNMATKVASDL
jgi:nucleoside-diphosphate-sugar epimerase